MCSTIHVAIDHCFESGDINIYITAESSIIHYYSTVRFHQIIVSFSMDGIKKLRRKLTNTTLPRRNPKLQFPFIQMWLPKYIFTHLLPEFQTYVSKCYSYHLKFILAIPKHIIFYLENMIFFYYFQIWWPVIHEKNPFVFFDLPLSLTLYARISIKNNLFYHISIF